ncbi:vancomycin high temperature exclusion protein [Streptomyces sp. NPDC049879]|uniref:vancomycin high temperature exclusion protein n=1 Tax=Streptomyces sp. NPDC049879 TaxID=3365598 RepID=UPI0037A603F7
MTDTAAGRTADATGGAGGVGDAGAAPGRGGRLRARARRLRPRVPRTVRGKRRALRLAVTLLALAMLPNAWVYAATDDRVRTTESAPAKPVALVFGAGLRADGTPTRWLADRLDTAAELYGTGRARVLLVSGDNSTAAYNEPEAMRTYLVERHGIPAEHVVADYAGLNTWASCSRAAEVFGVEEALLVSQDFHIRRALALCEAAGIDAWGVGVGDHASILWVVSGLRETAGAATAAWTAAFTPEPEIAGPRETAVQDALRAGP